MRDDILSDYCYIDKRRHHGFRKFIIKTKNKKENKMAKGQSLQDPYLNALRRERIPVSIYLVNGIKLQGQIESFDQFVILLKNTVNQMVYKHAISTVVPARSVTHHNNNQHNNHAHHHLDAQSDVSAETQVE